MIYVIIYILGMPVAYLLFRADWISKHQTWTVRDRKTGLLVSLISWYMLAPFLLFKLMEIGKKNDSKPAKW
jgi:hypothetical protein